MRKIHPNASVPASLIDGGGEAVLLTVWRKSLLPSCSGFTVFDSKGNLVFRVDVYGSGNKGEIVLMDAEGEPLLTIRKKKLSLGVQWQIYEGEDASTPRFSVRGHLSFIHCRALAHVTPCSEGVGETYTVEGSYSQGSCAFYGEGRRRVAGLRRKESAGGMVFGADLFRLAVEPGFEPATAMAVVIILDQMFGSKDR